jgi:hypothetical protein
MASRLFLYTDASIVGRWLPGWGEPSRLGPGFIAWAAWHGCSLPDSPTFAGQAFVGEQGNNRAEFHAVLQGLAATLAYVKSRPVDRRPDAVVVRVDNAPVQRVMCGTDSADVLRPHFETLGIYLRAFKGLGVEVAPELVRDTDQVHKVAHRMTKLAPNQVLVEPAWRPVDDRPPKKPKGKKGKSRTKSTKSDVPPEAAAFAPRSDASNGFAVRADPPSDFAPRVDVASEFRPRSDVPVHFEDFFTPPPSEPPPSWLTDDDIPF